MPPTAILDTERRLRRAMDLMEQEIEGRPSIAALSQVAALSPYYFIRLFKTATGETPARYFRRRKVERADEYLSQHPETDLTELALKFGYSSQSALTRDFRALLGFLPGACRSKFQREQSNFLPKSSNS